MKRLPKAIGVLVVAALAAAGGIYLFRSGALGRKSTPPNILTLYGNVDIRQVELGFRVAGRIQAMQLEEGQSVTAHALMASLDPRTFEDELAAARAQVGALEANLNKLVAGSRPAEIARGRAELAEAEAAQQNAHVDLRRTETLVRGGATPRAEYESALAISRQADARVASARDSLRLLVQGSRAEDIAAARASLAVAEARLASARTALEDTRLFAPANGVVISRVQEPGAIVSPNDIVYVLSLTDSVWVRAYASEVQLGKLRPGMRADVLSDAAPSHPSHAHIGFISPTAEFTPKSVETPDLRTDLVYRLRVIVDSKSQTLRQGMPVTVRIATDGK
jgi:HlyD family secretion protein